MKRPSEIATMAELRAEIDALDARLVALLADRAQLIERAIQIKPGEGMPARIETRVEDVVAKVRARAAEAGVSPDLAERLWRPMMEFFIAREEEVLGSEGSDE